MALVGVELETLVSNPDALTTRPPFQLYFFRLQKHFVKEPIPLPHVVVPFVHFSGVLRLDQNKTIGVGGGV